MKNFEEIKTEFIQRCKAALACQPEFKRVLASATFAELLQVIKDNIHWSINEGKVINSKELEEWFTRDLCKEFDIYFEGHNIVKDKNSIHFNSSTSEHYGSSTSKHYGSSTSEHYGSSTSKHYGSSTSEHFNSSTSKHYGSSTSEHYGSSTSYSTSERQVINDNAIRRDIYSNRIYIKKSASEIIYIN